ncbi:hypothetical protein ES708_15379 [subsurface metagenome]
MYQLYYTWQWHWSMSNRNGMINYLLKNIVLILLIFLYSCKESNVTWSYVDEILDRIESPVFPERSYNIIDFGAIGDSITDCTSAITNAINTCSEEGGGKVIVPAGTFLTGALHMKSNVNLYIADNASLLFSKDLTKYLPVVHARFEGNDLMNYSPLIYARGQKNIAITGKGTLDGNADTVTWWPWKGKKNFGWSEELPYQKDDRNRLVEMANAGVPLEERIFGEGHFIRVNFIQFLESENILIENVTIRRSPMWGINPVLCTNVTVRGVTIISHGPNNDGCNPESCKDVLIENCYFNTGDDCIAIKSGREGDGRRINIPSEDIIIRNCEMKDGHGGVVIGSEISGGCRNIFIENCKMSSPNLDRALRIKSNSRRGGLIENIFMRDVQIGEVKQAVILVNFFYAEGDVGEYTPEVRNIFVENVSSEKSQYAIWLKGYERSPVTDIHISDCRFNGVADGNVISHVKNLEFRNVYINGKKITKEYLSDLNTVKNKQDKESYNYTP